MRRTLLNAANALLKTFKLKLSGPSHVSRERMIDSLKHIVAKGCNPRTCFDVGVAHGTPDLYAAFPHTKHVLIEPLTEYEADIKKIMQKYDCDYIQAAAGRNSGRIDMNVKDRITGSSIFKEQEGIAQGVLRKVSVVTLDEVCESRQLQGPFVVKIDVEGAEIDVISGATGVLQNTLALVAELTFVPRLVKAPEAGDVIQCLASHGFVLWDLFGFRLRSDQTLFQADATFVPQNSPFRKQAK